jgi:uncharacterized protein (AIM24 family)
MTKFRSRGEGQVAFAAPHPGKLKQIDLDPGRNWLCQRDSFLCATEGVEVNVAFTKRFGAGLFGGEGFILQRLSGDGTVFIHGGGNFVEFDLHPGQVLHVDTGCIVAFEESVGYDIKFVGGFKNALFGGEGLFLAVLQGPGKTILQTLPFSRLADASWARRARAAAVSPAWAGRCAISGTSSAAGSSGRRKEREAERRARLSAVRQCFGRPSMNSSTSLRCASSVSDDSTIFDAAPMASSAISPRISERASCFSRWICSFAFSSNRSESALA